MTANPILIQSPGAFTEQDGFIDFPFDRERKLKYVILKEDIRKSQRVEAFDLYVKKKNGKFKKVASKTIIGSCKIIKLKGMKCVGVRLVVRQSRSNPLISEIGFYE